MPKLNVEFRETLPGFEEGDIIEITKVEITQTMVRGFRGVRVEGIEVSSKQKKAEMLWIREVIGENSKLGAFIKVLGDDTDNWVGKKIEILEWKPRRRTIRLVK